MVTRHNERVARYLVEYTKYFRSYFSSAFRGNEVARQYSARKVMELNRIAQEELGNAQHQSFASQRDAFRAEFFEKFRDWMMVACAQEECAVLNDREW